jgi:predicted phosphoribosyltransferase
VAPRLFRDRSEAGRRLAGQLDAYAGRPGVIALGLPRGGVPVALEVARALDAPLDVFLVRKLGVPGHEELAMGAIASGGVRVLNDEVLDALGLPDEVIDAVAAREERELGRRERAYRGDAPPPALRDATALLVDDGLATGSSMRAAVRALREQGAARVVAAVPVAPAETCAALARDVDEMVCTATPEPFRAVGMWYRDFAPVSDGEVRRMLQASRARAPR